jgi:serine/threonine protein kinase/Tfp pilus assembly protein PilF
MDKPRRQIEALFEAALEHDHAEREAWLAEACGGDAALQAEVESLLEAHERGGGILSASPADMAAEGSRASGQPDADPHEALHAELGDRYELEEVLAEGGMATVFLARDRKHGRQVAIKTLHPNLTTGIGPQRFEREIQVTAGLQHPHILPLLDSGVAGPFLYYIMPYVPGESMRHRMQEHGSLGEEEAVSIGLDVLEALEHAHRQGVVHRDIKPENILLGEDHALVMDFGIAKAIADGDNGEALTQTGHAIGTPAYMAPEQFLGGATPRSDLYAVGAVMYESLTGRKWKVGADPLTAYWSSVGPALRRALQKALQPQPNGRWQDAAAFRRALVAARLPWWTRRAVIPAAAILIPLLAVLAYSGWSRSRSPSTKAGGKLESVAVLPFANIGGEETAFFVAGIHDDILTQLSKIADLRLISRTSVLKYGDTDLSIGEIAEELGVNTVLEGSVQRSGDRVRINLQLIDARTDDHLWAETYDNRLTAANIFAIQSDLARRVADALEATLTPEEERRLQQPPTQSLEAYDLYVRGLYLYHKGPFQENLEGAAELFRQAIEADPGYAPAHAGLADAYLRLHVRGYLPEAEALPLAKAAVERALELDETLADGHVSRGWLLQAERQFEAAEREYLRALELNPGNAKAHTWYGGLLQDLGRFEEAVWEARRAVELDPLSVDNRIYLANKLLFARAYDEAIVEAERILDMAPDRTDALYFLGLSHSMKDEHREGIAALEKAIELTPGDPYYRAGLAYIHARAGAYEEALRILHERQEQSIPLKEIALVYAALGELDQAFEYLDRAFEEERASLHGMKADPTADPLRTDPRFEELLRKVGLE